MVLFNNSMCVIDTWFVWWTPDTLVSSCNRSLTNLYVSSFTALFKQIQCFKLGHRKVAALWSTVNGSFTFKYNSAAFLSWTIISLFHRYILQVLLQLIRKQKYSMKNFEWISLQYITHLYKRLQKYAGFFIQIKTVFSQSGQVHLFVGKYKFLADILL